MITFASGIGKERKSKGGKKGEETRQEGTMNRK